MTSDSGNLEKRTAEAASLGSDIILVDVKKEILGLAYAGKTLAGPTCEYLCGGGASCGHSCGRCEDCSCACGDSGDIKYN
ncbi:MAG: hypothetical protein AABW57_00735 [Nanoarchaeota archaeon]